MTKSLATLKNIIDDVEEKEESIISKRKETESIAKNGLGKFKKGSEISQMKKDIAQYNAGTALLWDREKFLQESGWSVQKLSAVENSIVKENRRKYSKIDPKIVFNEYKIQQMQAAAELMDIALEFKNSRQYPSLVSAIKTRSDILDKIIKVGQDLGVINRSAKEVNINQNMNIQSMSISELKVTMKKELSDMKEMIYNDGGNNLIDKVLNNITSETNSLPEHTEDVIDVKEIHKPKKKMKKLKVRVGGKR